MKQNEIIKLGFILFIITAISGFILGGAYKITKTPIEKQLLKENNDAMRDTLPDADNFEKLNVSSQNSIIKEINKGLRGSTLVGYTIKVTPKGYGGPVEIMVGISNKGNISGIKILSQNETPGLGANAVLPDFYGQYTGKTLEPELEVVKVTPSKENEIQAMTGATITSKAVTNGVNEVIKLYNTQLKDGGK